MTKQKSVQRKSTSGLLFTAKILQEAMYFTFPNWAKSLTIFSSKMLDLKRVLDLKLRVKGGLNIFVFFIGFQMLKILFFQMALNTSKM